MELKTIKGMDNAEKALDRTDPLDMSALPDAVVARTAEAFGPGVTPEQSVVNMLRDVRVDGDAAVRRYAKLLDGVDLDDFRVGPGGNETGQGQRLQSAEESVGDRRPESYGFPSGGAAPQLGGPGKGFGGNGAPVEAGGAVRPRRHRRLSFHRT